LTNAFAHVFVHALAHVLDSLAKPFFEKKP